MKTILKLCIAVILLTLYTGSVFANSLQRTTSVPYQVELEVYWSDGGNTASVETAEGEGVPEGMRLVLSNINYLVLPDGDQKAHCLLYRPGGDELAYLPAPASWINQGVSNDLAGYANMSLEVHVDEGDYGLYCIRSGYDGIGRARAIITGTLTTDQRLIP